MLHQWRAVLLETLRATVIPNLIRSVPQLMSQNHNTTQKTQGPHKHMRVPSRRRFIAGFGCTVLSSKMAVAATEPELTPTTFVLVHGSFLGGWCWRDVKKLLMQRGHTIYTPTLTGLGERRHLRSPEIGLQTHINDVINLIAWEELTDLVLVGHSYGGTVITGVCDALKDRIRHVVYLDSNVPRNGETNYPGITRQAIEQAYGDLAEGYLIPPPPLSDFGLTPDNVSPEIYAWYERRLTAHPSQTYLEPLRLENRGSEGLPRTYIFCNRDRQKPYPPALQTLLNRVQGPSWSYKEIDSGHNAMTLAPQDLVALLLQAARNS